jgi:hypothetical protein
MRRFAVVALVLMASASSQTARASDVLGVPHTPNLRPVIASPRGEVVPQVTRLHPVIGSVHRVGHFTNPFTHKAKYSSLSYNPLLGSFSTQTFKR